jgi:hypothetical protein
MVRAIIDGTKTMTRRIYKEGRIPFYAGQYLWVKETWRTECGVVIYKATDCRPASKWKSSLFMPRKHSRLLLLASCVRTERLQDISNDDALAEGVTEPPRDWGSAKNQFELLWDTINGKKYPWKSNPLVWVVEFRLKEHHHGRMVSNG